ncbi:hypothetical protein [Achromobacter xylosoxidans]|uniref:hypothetical protein n=1 Tax=Alcaligenes xylosoxydans xylosoxydans TaxID=85698 RepID=UPI0038FC1968
MSDNWLRDLFILNELENQRTAKDPDNPGPGVIFLIVAGLALLVTVSYPAVLFLQYRRKEWVAMGLTLLFGAVGYLWAQPRLIVSESEGLWAIAVTIGGFSLFGYLCYFFAKRISKKIAPNSPPHFDAKSIFTIFSFGYVAFFILWGFLVSFPILTGPTYAWLSQFIDLPGHGYFYSKLAWPYILGGTALAVSPMQAWCRKRLAEGKPSVPTLILVLAVPAFLFSIFWISVFTRNLFS